MADICTSKSTICSNMNRSSTYLCTHIHMFIVHTYIRTYVLVDYRVGGGGGGLERIHCTLNRIEYL